MEEVWKDIDGYSGYQVSNLGRVRTHDKITYTERHGNRHWKDRVLKAKISKKDQCARVNLWKDGENKTVLVHRLVANAFLEKLIDTDMTVNHKDGNRLNNRVDNLEWMTRGDNIRHGFDHDLYANVQKRCMLIDMKDRVRVFRSQQAANRFINRNHGYIMQCLKSGKTITDQKGHIYEVVLL